MAKDIIIALITVSSVGLIAGILLAIVSHLFKVEENVRTAKIRACMPGANCGACGYRGCDDYAEAISEGSAAPNLCIPGGEVTVAELSEILGIEIEKTAQITAFVHCNGNCEATEMKALYNGINSCKAASMIYGGPQTCVYGCLGFGDCAKVCPSSLICIKDGIAHIDTENCLGCGVCVKTCPKHIISLVPKKRSAVVMCSNSDKGADARKACSNACIGCKKCEKSCEFGAIAVVNNIAKIDYEKCSGCGKCVSNCPTSCIKELFADLT